MSGTTEFRMPSLGADMDEGTLLEWLVAPGDHVHHGQVVAVVDTSKAAIEVEVFSDGVVDELLVEPGTTVEVGAALARLRPGDGSGETSELTRPPGATVSPVVRHLAHQSGVDLAALHGSGPQGAVTRGDVERAASAPVGAPARGDLASSDRPRVKASPLARRRAQERGVDLSTVVGTGPDDVVTVADVDAAAGQDRPPRPPVRDATEATEATAVTGAPTVTEAAARQQAMRDAIGALMARSKREIPHYYLRNTLDLSGPLAWLRQRNAAVGVEDRVVPAALLLKAAAVAARDVPEVNGFFVDDRFVPSEHVHLGVAVSLRSGGLVAPAIHDADTMSLGELMAALKDLVSRARAGRLRASQMSDPTLTVTNLGDQGVEEVQGVIYPPQVALVGFGRIVERPWAVDGMLGVHPLVVATLAADHRVTDGHRGGRYLAAVAAHLNRPEELDAPAS
jgi:pyruvate dehydrogenase E2 component (dihydrolipoamide acetyltransferase)